MPPSPEETNTTTEAAPPAPKAKGGWIPLILMVILMPALSFAMTKYLLIPQIQKSLVKDGVDVSSKTSSASKTAKVEGKNGEPTYPVEFKDIVANLSGSMKSRYIKVSFTAYSSDPDVQKIVDANKAKLLDATLGILSSLTITDTEDPTIKNKLRNQLLFAFQNALNGKVLEELYFSEFVIQ